MSAAPQVRVVHQVKISFPIRYRAAPLPEQSAIVFQSGELGFFFFSSFVPLHSHASIILYCA
jgi:hypothetical protein